MSAPKPPSAASTTPTSTGPSNTAVGPVVTSRTSPRPSKSRSSARSPSPSGPVSTVSVTVPDSGASKDTRSPAGTATPSVGSDAPASDSDTSPSWSPPRSTVSASRFATRNSTSNDSPAWTPSGWPSLTSTASASASAKSRVTKPSGTVTVVERVAKPNASTDSSYSPGVARRRYRPSAPVSSGKPDSETVAPGTGFPSPSVTTPVTPLSAATRPVASSASAMPAP